MKFLILFLGVLCVSAIPQQRRRQGNVQARRSGRQQDYLAPAAAPSDGYGAAADDSADYALPPVDNYGAASDESLESYGGDYSEDDYDINDVPADQAAPANEAAAPTYAGGADAAASDAAADEAGDVGTKMLMSAVPGVPGEDYPIYAEVPETGFACDGQVDGGYYADPEAECQAFHICSADGQGSLAKYSFLCPNGTIFNQNYFICDWWFNFDCSEAEALAAEKNGELAAARTAVDEAAAAASESDASYASPAGDASSETSYAAPDAAADYSSDYETVAADVGYGAPEAADDLPGYSRRV